MGEYHQLERTKRLLNIDDTIDDGVLNELGEAANNGFLNFLRSLTHDVPTGDRVTDLMYNAVSYEVVSKYLAIKKDYTGAEYWKGSVLSAREGVRFGIQRNVDKKFEVIPRF